MEDDRARILEAMLEHCSKKHLDFDDNFGLLQLFGKPHIFSAQPDKLLRIGTRTTRPPFGQIG